MSFFLFLAEADFSLIPMEKVSICSSSSELISGRKVFMETFWWKLPDQESYENNTSVSSAGKILHHLDLIYLSILIHHYILLSSFFFFCFPKICIIITCNHFLFIWSLILSNKSKNHHWFDSLFNNFLCYLPKKNFYLQFLVTLVPFICIYLNLKSSLCLYLFLNLRQSTTFKTRYQPSF